MEFEPKKGGKINYTTGEQRPVEDCAFEIITLKITAEALGERASKLAKNKTSSQTDPNDLPTAG